MNLELLLMALTECRLLKGKQDQESDSSTSSCRPRSISEHDQTVKDFHTDKDFQAFSSRESYTCILKDSSLPLSTGSNRDSTLVSVDCDESGSHESGVGLENEVDRGNVRCTGRQHLTESLDYRKISETLKLICNQLLEPSTIEKCISALRNVNEGVTPL